MTNYFILMKDEPPVQTALSFIRAIGVANNSKAKVRRGCYPASYRVEIELSAADLTSLESETWFSSSNEGGLLYKTPVEEGVDPIPDKWMEAQLLAFNGNEQQRIDYWQAYL